MHCILETQKDGLQSVKAHALFYRCPVHLSCAALLNHPVSQKPKDKRLS